MPTKKSTAPDTAPASDEVSLTFKPATVEVETRKPKPNPFSEAVNGLKVAPEGSRPEGVEVNVTAAMKDGTVYGFLDRAQEARNEADPEHPVTVRRKIIATDEKGTRTFLIWVIDKIVRKPKSDAA